MWRVIMQELRHRWGRSRALMAGIAVATSAFAVFTANADTQQLVVRGRVAHNFRGSYDILVRPKSSETTVERSQGLVRDNYLSGIFGGITLAQYHSVARTPGVAVAAPIAMIGYVLEPVSIEFNLTRDLNRAARQLFAVRVTRTTDQGLVHLADQSGYVYVTHAALAPPRSPQAFSASTEILASGRRVNVCPQTVRRDGSAASAFGQSERGIAFCWSHQSGFYGDGWNGYGVGRHQLGFFIHFPFPFLLAAVDPSAEAKLAGLSSAIVSGRYLHDDDRPRFTNVAEVGGGRIDVPVIVSTQPYIADQDEIVVRELPTTAAQAMVHDRTLGQVDRTIARAGPGAIVLRRSLGVARAYRGLLRAIGRQSVTVVQNYWSSGPARYRQLGSRTVAALPVVNPQRVWHSDYMATGQVDPPIDSALSAFRLLHPHVGIGEGVENVKLPSLKAVGTFDPNRLPGFNPLSRLPQETYNPPVAGPANPRTRQLLHGRDLLPDSNLAGYLQAPPLLLTDLNSISAFTDPTVFPNASQRAPISVIRVRVADIRNDDALSRERIRLVAQRIEQETHLQVDITAGSSPTPVRVDLPATTHTPALQLTEGWVEKGVAEKIISALDKQSLVLFVLILVVCAAFVYNAAAAAAQARRVQYGVLASLGWSGGELVRLIVGEQGTVGVAAGIVGAAIAIPISSTAGFHTSPTHALVAIPAAVLLTVLASMPPAIRAARMEPTAALRPPVLNAGPGWRVRSVFQLAVINTIRVPVRSALAAASLALGVGALTVLLAITQVFHDAITGSLLGSAVSLQVRGSDYAAVAVIVVLATAGIADVLYVSVRERAAELVALQATGWSDGRLTSLIVSESLWIGLTGSAAGAGLGILATSTFAGALPDALITVAAVAAAAGTIIAALAALALTATISRLATVSILAAE